MKAIIAKKQEQTKFIANEISRAKSFIIFEYKGLSASAITSLRKLLTKADSKMYVLKNNILRRAFEQASLKEFDPLCVGPNAIAFGFSDEISIFKDIFELKKTYDFINIKAGYFNGKFVDAKEAAVIASIPNREGLYGMLLSCLTSPIRSVMYALNAVCEKK